MRGRVKANQWIAGLRGIGEKWRSPAAAKHSPRSRHWSWRLQGSFGAARDQRAEPG